MFGKKELNINSLSIIHNNIINFVVFIRYLYLKKENPVLL